MIDDGVPTGIRLRSEAPGDEPAVRALTDAAFAPSAVEGRIVDALRGDADAWVPELSIVAVEEGGGAIVGHVVTSAGTLQTADGTVRPILGLGPISVAPDRQGQGIGAALMVESIARATAAGWPVIVLLGHADYYPRFGFESARALGIEPPQPWRDANWMASDCRAGPRTSPARCTIPGYSTSTDVHGRGDRRARHSTAPSRRMRPSDDPDPRARHVAARSRSRCRP